MWQGAHVVAIGVAAQEWVSATVPPPPQACTAQHRTPLSHLQIFSQFESVAHSRHSIRPSATPTDSQDLGLRD